MAIDQSQFNYSFFQYVYGSTNWAAQTYVPDYSGNQDKIKLRIKKQGSPPNLIVEIRNTSGDLPGSSILASKEISASAISTSDTWFEITFSSPPSLTEGTRYAIVIHTKTSGGDSSNRYICYRRDTDTYDLVDGRRCTSADGGSNWSGQTDDLAFITYIAGVGIEHSSNITSNETWYKADNPHDIIGTIGVVGATLTIEPGCIIRLYSYPISGEFYVSNAKLIANGTPDEWITFLGLGDYRDIMLENYPSNGYTNLSYCKFNIYSWASGGGYCLIHPLADYGSGSLHHLILKQHQDSNTATGIMLDEAITVNIDHIVVDNFYNNIMVYDGTINLKNSIIVNGYRGLWADTGKVINSDYNDVWNNDTNYDGDASAGTNDITQNPLFEGGDPYDYALGDSSPCLTSGQNGIWMGAVDVYILDQKQIEIDGSYDTYQQYYNGQTFEPDISGELKAITVLLDKIGSPASLIAEIRTTSGGLPTTTILATETISASDVNDDYETYITFSSSPYLTLGTKYAIILHTAGDSSNKYQWKDYEASDKYADGDIVYSINSGSSWSLDSGDDMYFMTFMLPLVLVDIDNDIRTLKLWAKVDITSDFRMVGNPIDYNIANDFRMSVELIDTNNDFRMVGVLVRTDMDVDFRSVIESELDLSNKIKTTKLVINNIIQKFNSCIEVVKNITNVVSFNKQSISDVSNDIRFQKKDTYDIDNDFRMIWDWQITNL